MGKNSSGCYHQQLKAFFCSRCDDPGGDVSSNIKKLVSNTLLINMIRAAHGESNIEAKG